MVVMEALGARGHHFRLRHMAAVAAAMTDLTVRREHRAIVVGMLASTSFCVWRRKGVGQIKSAERMRIVIQPTGPSLMIMGTRLCIGFAGQADFRQGRQVVDSNQTGERIKLVFFGRSGDE